MRVSTARPARLPTKTCGPRHAAASYCHRAVTSGDYKQKSQLRCEVVKTPPGLIAHQYFSCEESLLHALWIHILHALHAPAKRPVHISCAVHAICTRHLIRPVHTGNTLDTCPQRMVKYTKGVQSDSPLTTTLVTFSKYPCAVSSKSTSSNSLANLVRRTIRVL